MVQNFVALAGGNYFKMQQTHRPMALEPPKKQVAMVLGAAGVAMDLESQEGLGVPEWRMMGGTMTLQWRQASAVASQAVALVEEVAVLEEGEVSWTKGMYKLSAHKHFPEFFSFMMLCSSPDFS